MRLKWVVVVAFLVMSTQALADKVRVLGVQEALLSTKAAADFRAKMEREFSAEEKAVVDLERQAIAARERLDRNHGLVSEKEFEQLVLQFQKVATEHQTREAEMIQKRMQREQEFLAEMRPKLDQAIRSLIENEKIEVIIAKQATVYTSNAVDITPRVVELLNRQ